jgi:hypothetical protein
VQKENNRVPPPWGDDMEEALMGISADRCTILETAQARAVLSVAFQTIA